MKFLLIILIAISFQSLSQSTWNNLVENNSFEELNFTIWNNLCQVDHSQHGQLDVSYCGLPGDQDDTLMREYWNQMDYWSLPRKKNFVFSPYVGTPDIYTEQITYPSEGVPRSGTSWLSTAQEFIVIELEEELIPGVEYYIEVFFEKIGVKECRISAYDRFPKHWNAASRTLEQNNSQHFENIMTWNNSSLNGWTRKRAYFTVSEPRKWLSIGGHGDFEDVKIYKAIDLCKDVWYFDNTVFNYPLEIFQAGDFIKAGTGVDPEQGQVDGPVTVLGTSHTIFRAGNAVLLESGFQVNSSDGAIFDVIIEPCLELCPPISFPQLVHDCISVPTEIGIDSYVGTFAQMSWSPTTFLSDPNSENPIFEPSGTNGSITYTVAYEQDCDYIGYEASGTFTVVVNFSDGLNTAPTVGYSSLLYDNYDLSCTININDVVNSIIISFVSPDLGPIQIEWIRDIDFVGNNIPFYLNSILSGCCGDSEILISAKDGCGQTVSTTILWPKVGAFGITSTLPNVITPNGDGDNDYYCFETNLACFYEVQVIHPWGPVVFEATGSITEPYICPWDGKKTNGNDLTPGNYWILVTLTNSCGDEYQSYTLIVILDGMAPIFIGDNNSQGIVENQSGIDTQIEAGNSDVMIAANGQQLMILDNLNRSFQITIMNNLGQIIHNGNFDGNFQNKLASGIYYIFLSGDDGAIIKKKIVIL